MQSTGVVDVVDEGADLALGVFAAAIGLAVDSSALSVCMKLSALALSCGVPGRLMLAWAPIWLSRKA